MRPIMIAFASLMFSAACSAAAPDGQMPDAELPASEPQDAAQDPNTPVGGTGSPDAQPIGPIDPNCHYRVGARCFTDADAACQAAGCERAVCRIAESFPAQVFCDQP